MLEEAGLLKRSIIYATDFNGTILEQAKNGIYPREMYERFKENYKKSGGKREFEKWWKINDDFVEISPHIREKIQFFQHNLVTDGEINEFHMVFCRNVLIYFDEELQKKVFKLIHDSLVRDGFLILGESESARVEDGFMAFNEITESKIFKRI